MAIQGLGEGDSGKQVSDNVLIKEQKAREVISAANLAAMAKAVNNLMKPTGGAKQIVAAPIGAARPQLFRVTANALASATPPADGEVEVIPIDADGADVGTSPADDKTLKKRTDIDLYKNDIVKQAKVSNAEIVTRASGAAEYTQGDNKDLTSTESSTCSATGEDATEWERVADENGVSIDVVTNMCWNDSTGDFVQKRRRFDFDRHGILRKIGAEEGELIFGAGCS